MAKKKNQHDDSAELNFRTYQSYLDRLTEICLNLFKWHNLPDTVDKRFMELTLFQDGYVLYFNDEIMGNLTLQCTLGGNEDIYRNPIQRKAYAPNGYNNTLDNSNSVIIYNNYLRTPSFNTVELFARRLYECERAEDVNIKNQKTPKMILSTEQQRLTMTNLMQQYSGNIPFIYGDKNLDIEDIQAIDITAPFVADKINIHKHNIFNEFLTWCGVENANGDKRERLVASEVGANSGAVEMGRNTMLSARQEACEKINKMFGTNISVEFNSSLATMLNSPSIFISNMMDNLGGVKNE